jgi:hypothetical protein
MARDKPTSIRLPSDVLEEIDMICGEEGCSRNDKITSLIQSALTPEDTKPEPIIKEVMREVPVEKIVEKVVEKPVIQTKYVDRPVEKIVEKTKVIAPQHLPSYTCVNGCNHPNKNYKKRVKGKCRNCDQFSKNDFGKCTWCGSDDIEPITKEDLSDLRIPLPDPYNNYSESYSCPSSHCTGIIHNI